jgi:hypothetical protein
LLDPENLHRRELRMKFLRARAVALARRDKRSR